MTTLIEAIFTGFGIYSLVYVLIPSTRFKSKEVLFKNLDEIACITFSIGGLLFLGHWLFSIYHAMAYPPADLDPSYLKNRMFGPHWYGYWLQPVLYLLATQLLWLKKIREIKWLRFIVGLIMLISLEELVIMLSSMHQDFLPASWGTAGSGMLIQGLMYLGIFMILVGVGYYVKVKLGKG